MNILVLVLFAGVVTSDDSLDLSSANTLDVDGPVELPPAPRCLPRDLSSWGYKYYEEQVNVMQMGKVMNLTLQKEHYDHAVICVQNETFGFTATTLWVSGGCRGSFTVCYNTSENIDGKIQSIVAQTDERLSDMARLVAEIKADQSKQMSEVLSSMDESNRKTATVVNDLKRRCSKQERELTDLKSVKKQDIARLNGLNSDQIKEINSLKSSANSYKKSIQLLRSQSAQQSTKISTIQSASKNFIDKTKCVASSVAFSAGLRVDTNVGVGKTVVYNRIMASVGGGYNGNTGIFTCQVPGMYTFNVEALTVHNAAADLHIFHNNSRVARLYVTKGAFNSGSTSAVIRLNKRDTVQVRGDHRTSGLHDAAHGPHNTFSGIRTPDLLQDCV